MSKFRADGLQQQKTILGATPVSGKSGKKAIICTGSPELDNKAWNNVATSVES